MSWSYLLMPILLRLATLVIKDCFRYFESRNDYFLSQKKKKKKRRLYGLLLPLTVDWYLTVAHLPYPPYWLYCSFFIHIFAYCISGLLAESDPYSPYLFISLTLTVWMQSNLYKYNLLVHIHFPCCLLQGPRGILSSKLSLGTVYIIWSLEKDFNSYILWSKTKNKRKIPGYIIDPRMKISTEIL